MTGPLADAVLGLLGTEVTVVTGAGTEETGLLRSVAWEPAGPALCLVGETATVVRDVRSLRPAGPTHP